ncbi:DUF1593 domain-containing protein [Candidatus Poribacteria bacterium]|nr:DUF1593 domain-containing protein [Candidatus Poribacteria bacterium]
MINLMFTLISTSLLIHGFVSEEQASKVSLSKTRIIMETDAPGGDPDDEASLVRFFLYINEWDIDGLIGTRKASQSRLNLSGKDRILQYIDDYEKVYHNLTIHKKDYPHPDFLRQRTKSSYDGTEGMDLVISVIDKDDPRPVWYINWGTNEGNIITLKQALDKAKNERRPEEYKKFASKIRYVGAYTQDHIGEHYKNIGFYMDTFFPVMDGGRWYHRWAPLTEHAGGFNIDEDVKKSHGPLCANYTIVKEGDTMTFMHLIPNGLNDINHPEWGGWSGRYSLNKEFNMWWCDQRDEWGDTTNRDNTLARWANHIQNDFKARSDWCIAERFVDANHEPIPCLQGDSSYNTLHINAPAGQDCHLSASGSMDPDGDELSYRWTYYSEAGTYKGHIYMEGNDSENCVVKIPSDASGKGIHIILQVTDHGKPALTRYRRAIINVTGI